MLISSNDIIIHYRGKEYTIMSDKIVGWTDGEVFTVNDDFLCEETSKQIEDQIYIYAEDEYE